MILNEKVEDYFNNKELETITRMQTTQHSYNNLTDSVSSPYNPNTSNIIDISIKDDVTNVNQASMSGIIDYTNSQFVIKKLDIQAEVEDKISVIKRLINSIIVNLETNQISISTIYWRLNKENTECLKAALDSGFSVQDSNNYSFELTYYLASFPARLSTNSSKVLGAINRMHLNTGQF